MKIQGGSRTHFAAFRSSIRHGFAKKIIRRAVEKPGEFDNLVGLRIGEITLPFGNRLACDLHIIRELFLHIVDLASFVCDLFTRFHGISPRYPRADGILAPEAKGRHQLCLSFCHF